MVGLPSFLAALLLSLVLSASLEGMISGIMEDIRLAGYIGLLQAVLVLACAALVIGLAVLLASIPVMRKKPRDILTDLS